MENIKKNIRSYIANNILFSKGDYPYSDRTSLLEEGIIDSMNVLELVMFVENNFGFSVEDQEIIPENFDSVENLASYVERKSLVKN
jgi:acyl carrier protein